MEMMFPRTMVGGVSLPRMLIGTNWLVGFSHTSVASDHMITAHHASRESIAEVIEAYLEYGIDAMMGPMGLAPILVDAAKLAEDHTGKKVILIDTPWTITQMPAPKPAPPSRPPANSAQPFACRTTPAPSSWCARTPAPSTACRITSA